MRIASAIGAAGTILALPGLLNAANVPEYLKAERPIPESLEAAPSTTDQLGVTPESRSMRALRGFFSPLEVLPMMREAVPPSGIPFLDNIVFTFQPRFYYRYLDTDVADAEAAAYGGAMMLESGWLYDVLRVTLAGYTSQKLYGPRDRDGTGLLRRGQEPYTVLGQVFAELKLGEESSFFIGRSRIDTPYINANDGRMTPNTFEGLGLRCTAFPKLQFGVGHLTRIKARNSSGFVMVIFIQSQTTLVS